MPTSSSLSVDKRRRTYVRLIGEIHHALHQALEEEYAARKLTQQGMAEALDTEKSFISRKMNGLSNMTLETLADLAFALDRAVKVKLVSRHSSDRSNQISDQSETTKNWPEIRPKSLSTADDDAEIPIKPQRENKLFELEPAP